jgi:hypothetical protein
VLTFLLEIDSPVADMGAYEFQGDAAEAIHANLTNDGVVSLDDFETLLNCWSSSDERCCLPDLDLDGNVGVVDFLILLANWGPKSRSLPVALLRQRHELPT